MRQWSSGGFCEGADQSHQGGNEGGTRALKTLDHPDHNMFEIQMDSMQALTQTPDCLRDFFRIKPQEPESSCNKIQKLPQNSSLWPADVLSAQGL